MKRLLIPIPLLISYGLQAQITLEHSYTNAGHNAVESASQQLYIVSLEADSDKYLFVDKESKELKFFNLDHTLWKTVDYSQATDMNPNANGQTILYVSQHLFDLDDEIEFLYFDFVVTPAIEVITEIINEDGTVLFSAPGEAALMNASSPQDQLPIRNTTEGTKLILSDDATGNGEAHVYSLPGVLAVTVQEQVNELSFVPSSMSVYPNPSGSEIRLDYDVPFASFVSMRITDELGRLVKTENLAGNNGTYTLNTSGLMSGVYFCSLISNGNVLATERLVISE